ncbi:MAG: carboxylesterase/lipase family protein [Actinobacteria bacterium]|nr:carboxylesterase/lipase family protein [Actinomycetota bacterium]
MSKVKVSGGILEGSIQDGVTAFLGVPYAAAPIGPLRWHAPQALEPWSGIRQALDFGAIAPQPPMIPGMAIPGDPEDDSEDCLNLNIWTPACDGEQRPVMVFIHGGSFVTGTGASIIYRGDRLVRRGDVVVVTINYRLGALGFLAHRALRDADGQVGNYGLMDQVAALEWVRENIAGFGGDPGNVTLFGESAGSIGIAALLGAPSARGLFQRAILESGPVYVEGSAEAEEVGDEFCGLLGIHEPDRARLEQIPAGDLVTAVAEIQARPEKTDRIELPFIPVVDGSFITEHPFEALAAGAMSGLELMIGTNKDEMTMFAFADPKVTTMDRDGLIAWGERSMPELPAAELVAAYEAARSERGEPIDAPSLWMAIGADRVFRWPSLQLATRHHQAGSPAFVYLFTQETPVFGGILGSCHALELPFVFGTIADENVARFAGGSPEADALSASMMDAWISFARTGNPSTDALGQWPAWTPEERETMVFGPSLGVQPNPRGEELAIFAERLPFPRK